MYMPNSANSSKRIACYGFIEEQAGSVASASFLILEELLKRGHHIDFYAIAGFVYPESLFVYPNFCYYPVSIPIGELLYRIRIALPKFPQKIFSFLVDTITLPVHYRYIQLQLTANHRGKAYDYLLMLGLACFCKIKGLPTISWMQTPPGTEEKVIVRLRDLIVQLNGWKEYLKLRLAYLYIRIRDWNALKNSDIYICGSDWSVQHLIDSGVAPAAAHALPYPVDLDMFKPKYRDQPAPVKTFLHIGRLVPRKRLDLLLEAFALLVRERPDVRLLIVGDFRYAKGYRQLLDNPALNRQVEYRPFVERSLVPALMQAADLIIQTSESENFGTAIAEAQCYGLPVIVGPTNGTKDYISPSSFVFERYDPLSIKASMVKALEALEADHDHLLNSEARQTAEKQFSLLNIVDRLEQICDNAKLIAR
jgi:glycosyltransferase involved in cell wall biosynthesis